MCIRISVCHTYSIGSGNNSLARAFGAAHGVLPGAENRRRFFAGLTSAPVALLDRALVLPLAVFEVVEVRGTRAAGHVLARYSDECAGEVRRARRSRLVREDAGVEQLRQELPRIPGAIRETQPLAVHLHAQLDAPRR